MKKILLPAIGIGLFYSAPLFAAYKMGEAAPVPVGDRPATRSSTKKIKKIVFPPMGSQKEDPEIAVLQSLSDQYSVPVERLKYFRGLHHGYEEIVPALIVAREAQVEPGKILQMRVQDKTWKDIAGEYHIELKPLNDEVVSIIQPLRKSLPKAALTEKPQTRQ